MNLDDRTLLELREDIFEQYRSTREEIRELEQRNQDLHIQLEKLHGEMRKKNHEQELLKSLISIMIEEDCDPVTAKLKHGEKLKESLTMDKTETSSTYGYKFTDVNVYNEAGLLNIFEH